MTGLNVNWEQIGEILVLLFVISVVFETALTPIFNWRFFAKHWEGKGVKTPVTIVAAVALLWNYDIDIFKHIIDAFAAAEETPATAQVATETSSTFIGRIMTGLLVAGGSGAVFNIFTKLGLRSPDKLVEKAQQAREQAKEAREQAEKEKKAQASQTAKPPSAGAS